MTMNFVTMKCGELSAANRSRAVELLRRAADTLEQDREALVWPLLSNLLSVYAWLIGAVDAWLNHKLEALMEEWPDDPLAAISALLKDSDPANNWRYGHAPFIDEWRFQTDDWRFHYAAYHYHPSMMSITGDRSAAALKAQPDEPCHE